METRDIHSVTTYKDHTSLFVNKNVPLKKDLDKTNIISFDVQKSDDPHKDISSSFTSHHVGTRVAFSIEKDLHIVVTTVKDANTNKVIRQIPQKETIDRIKLLSIYYKQPFSGAIKY